MSFLSKIFKSYSEKEVKRIYWMVKKINDLEPEMEKLSDLQLRGKTEEFKDRLEKGETLDSLLIEAFAVCREASKRVLAKRHFDVQLIGGIILHQGRIAEMRTGEGKTLVATLPAYLNALTGRGVHVITVNDYLAKRDSEWMGKIYSFLGLTVGLVVHDMKHVDRQKAYNCDITYGTNNEYGFDYLRDNMVISKEEMVQRELHYAIIDEIDSILIDEARTPLIISGMGEKSSDLYKTANEFARKLKAKIMVESNDKENETEEDKDYDYVIDLKAKSATLTENGVAKAERFFGIQELTAIDNTLILHHINQAIRANGIMRKDKDYVVKDGEVLIVDEFTGRIMYGRRYNEGLHQAIEAKENVKVEHESKTLATITFQNYFRMYKKLSGMTGTAMTEEAEFRHIYKLDVVTIPTNRSMVRKDLNDIVYKTEKVKFKAVVNDIIESNKRGQPVLVGTITIEKSEELSDMLRKVGIKHEVLNAKYHEKEAEIIAQAGKFGAVTIATNMAGRGTDIMLGGNSEYLAKKEMAKLGFTEELIIQSTALNEVEDEEIIAARVKFNELNKKFEDEIQEEKEKVVAAGGLRIIGTERHESRRIDNQLRGRAGRQGDPGDTRFYISLEDDIMKLFGSQRIISMFNALNMPEDTPITHSMLSNTIETAQKTIEGRHFSQRKHVLQFDDVMNLQREIIYKQRRQVLDGENIKDNLMKMRNELIEQYIELYCEDSKRDNWEIEGLRAKLKTLLSEEFKLEATNKSDLYNEIVDIADEKYLAKEEAIQPEHMRTVERILMLQTVDNKWMDHIDDMDQLKNGISLRAYAQKDPVVEYRIEGFDMFDQMIAAIKEEVISLIYRVKPMEKVEMKQNVVITSESGGEENLIHKPVKKDDEQGRNDLCSCGSGKKYKKCCGK